MLILQVCEELTQSIIATLTSCFADVAYLSLPSEDTFVGSGSLRVMLNRSSVFHLFHSLR